MRAYCCKQCKESCPEVNRLKAEVHDLRYAEAEKELCIKKLDAWKSLAEKMREALSWISKEYERGEQKGYDMKMTPQMNGLAKEALAIYESMGKA